ncbi:MAG: CPBP family intramembrane metalloprotease [Streptococcaceae bacterium]|nr:CPBP family intramembrane metalloprotease [Streptococcaceae bacterium]
MTSFFTLLILMAIVVGIVLLCVLTQRFRHWFWLLLASQIPMTLLSIFMSINQNYGRSLLGDSLEIIIWAAAVGTFIWLAYRAARKYNVIPPFNMKFFRWGRMFIGLLMLYFSSLLVNIVTVMLTNSAASTQNQASLDTLALQIPFIIYFLSVILAGFFEELVFRVGIFEILLPKHQNWAFIVSVILFTAAHGPTDWPSLFIYGFYAIILGAFYYKYRNYYLNMSIHMLLNLVGVTTFFLSQFLHMF